MMKIFRDERAQAVPFGYLIAFVISMMLLVTTVLSYQAMVAGTARLGYADIGNDVAGTITDICLATATGSTGTVNRTIEIPLQVGGDPYVIKTNEYITVPGTSIQAILITARGAKVYVPLSNIEHGISVEGEVPSGSGRVMVEYDIAAKKITLR
ncbi:MAG: hypothetical protein QMC78_06370 [Methanocellales archaeon]|nr:hypothetical protein [Methanocellales archaeon]